jgi:hypothetical protein
MNRKHCTVARIFAGTVATGLLVVMPAGIAAAENSAPPTPTTAQNEPSPPTSDPTTTEPPTSTNPGGDPTGANIRLTPRAVHPGSTITVQVAGTCEKTAPTSKVFSRVVLSDAAMSSEYFSAKIKSSIDPGTYDVSATCAGRVLGANLTVLDSQPQPTATQPTESTAPTGQVAVVPRGPADTGDGSTADQDTAAAPVAVGVLAVLTGASVGGYSLLRRRNTNG